MAVHMWAMPAPATTLVCTGLVVVALLCGLSDAGESLCIPFAHITAVVVMVERGWWHWGRSHRDRYLPVCVYGRAIH